MSEIPEDIINTVNVLPLSGDGYPDQGDLDVIARAILLERTRCLSIVQSIETTSAQGKRVIDEIMQKVRGGE